jgi:hypothetical protein
MTLFNSTCLYSSNLQMKLFNSTCLYSSNLQMTLFNSTCLYSSNLQMTLFNSTCLQKGIVSLDLHICFWYQLIAHVAIPYRAGSFALKISFSGRIFRCSRLGVSSLLSQWGWGFSFIAACCSPLLNVVLAEIC